MSTSSTPTTNFKLSSLAKFRNWKWGFSEKRGSGGSLIMETLPTFPLIFLGSKNSGKESLFNRVVADRFHQKNIASSAAASKCNDPSRYRMKQTDGGVLTGVRSIQVGSGKYATTCWSEVLCCKGNSFSETSYPIIEHLWGRMRGAVLIVDALAAFANGTIESSINHMINVCNRMERECLGVETQLMIVVTKCDLLYEECGLTAKEIFDDTMKYFHIDYIYTSAKVWRLCSSSGVKRNKNGGVGGVGGFGCVNPNQVLKIMSRKMLEWHLNFEQPSNNGVSNNNNPLTK